MLSFKNLIPQILILATAFAALTICSPSERLANDLFRRSEPASDAIAPTSPAVNGVTILDKAQFEASGLTLYTGSPDDAASDPNYFIACATTVASPWVWNVNKVAEFLSNFNGWFCCNWHVSGGDCSHVMTIEDADTALCGNKGCIACEEMQANLYRIVQYCKWMNKAGGVSFLYNEQIHIVVY
ncbi:hypothetical protein L873DRAFT_1840892 [Choiromyces venosus 120613-1]|uniref:Ecp2 effector protein domain-containing protein n=1 Tax=Choiromyces venosus 120613-1 TaxID=1336337 RepID=A0A3N4K5G1_9PEZI|nr:hypothetical protein L873DRAFT_1840892 [Choiromyces venosus 120613-1]